MTTTKTIEAPSKQAAAFFNAVSAIATMLWSRWQDEMAYEDINDYRAPLQRKGDEFGVTITKMHKRPFGCEFKVNEQGHEDKVYLLKVTAGQYVYNRIA